MKKFLASHRFCVLSDCRPFFFFLCLPFFITPACTTLGGTQSRKNLETLLEVQEQQSEKLAHVTEISEKNLEQYESLLPFFQDLLNKSREQEKATSQIRRLLAEYEKGRQEARLTERFQASALADSISKKIVIGGVEVVRLVPPDIAFHARVDTGATTSSLDARNISIFERDGERWVRFEIPDPKGGEMIPMEQKVSRTSRILQANAEKSEERIVVELSITCGGITQLTEFTLTDRNHLKYPILIGRNTLKDIMIVDVSRPVPALP